MRHAATSTFTDARPLSTRAPASPSRLAVVVARVAWLVGLPGRIAGARRDMALLGQMSAGELADIGLASQDVRDAAALPLGTAPGSLLMQRAAERRRAALGRRR